MLPKWGNCALASVLWLGCSLPAQVPKGKIIGTAVDDQGVVLPGAAVEATSSNLVVNGALFMPYNRANLSRTPFLWFANLYLEYSLKLGKTALPVNLNVDNLFDTATTVRRFPGRTLYEAMVMDDQLLSKNWELETSGYAPDPRFNKEYGFYPPLSARLGMRFVF